MTEISIMVRITRRIVTSDMPTPNSPPRKINSQRWSASRRLISTTELRSWLVAVTSFSTTSVTLFRKSAFALAAGPCSRSKAFPVPSPAVSHREILNLTLYLLEGLVVVEQVFERLCAHQTVVRRAQPLDIPDRRQRLQVV